MHILLDECLPRKLRLLLKEHDIKTVQEVGWSGIKNGELLNRAEAAGFKIFITVDHGMLYQQNFKNRSLSLIILNARSNQIEDIRPLTEYIVKALQTIKPGEFIVVGM